MIHRYDGYLHHADDYRYSWKCSCGAQGAIRFDAVSGAKFDYELHQREELRQGATSCDLCTAVTDDPARSDDNMLCEPGLDLCDECHRDNTPRVIRMGMGYAERMGY